MLPAFAPGDHVLTFNWGKLKANDVVVFRLPMSLRGSGESRRRSNLKDRLLHFVRNDTYEYFIKRIDKKVYNYVYVSGDNRLKSSKMKPVKRKLIVGKVILKY